MDRAAVFFLMSSKAIPSRGVYSFVTQLVDAANTKSRNFRLLKESFIPAILTFTFWGTETGPRGGGGWKTFQSYDHVCSINTHSRSQISEVARTKLACQWTTKLAMGARPIIYLSTRHSLHIRKFLLLDLMSSRASATVLRNPVLKSALGIFQCMHFRHTFQQQTRLENDSLASYAQMFVIAFFLAREPRVLWPGHECFLRIAILTDDKESRPFFYSGDLKTKKLKVDRH